MNNIFWTQVPASCLVSEGFLKLACWLLCSQVFFPSSRRLTSHSGLRMEMSGVMERMGPKWTVGSCRPWLRRMRRSTSTMKRRLEWVIFPSVSNIICMIRLSSDGATVPSSFAADAKLSFLHCKMKKVELKVLKV